VISNPAKTEPGRMLAIARHLSRQAGWDEPLSLETTIHDAGRGCAEAALRRGADAVIVAGGDGTVRAVADAMADTGTPLTIVPSGTGNLFARNLGLPLDDPERAMAAAFGPRRRAVDIGRVRAVRPDGTVEETVFVVMAGMGMDAAMIANTRPRLKKAVGWVAYVDGAARSLPRARPFPILLQTDRSRVRSTRVYSILFANCGALPAGIALIPDASVEDGRMDVVLIRPRDWWGWLAVWRRVWWDNSVLRRFRAGRLVLERRRDQSVHYLRAVSADAGAHPAQAVQLDGEPYGEATRLSCRILPGALLLAAPGGGRRG
jgi:diacylglycerol kinase family enzyme